MPTVLVVDDEPAILTLAARSLRLASYEVLEAASGTHAWGYFERQPTTIDVLLTDVMMPDLSGPELAARVRSIRPDLPILLMSGYSPADLSARGLEVTDAPIITKPFKLEELASRVGEALAGRRAAPARLPLPISPSGGLGPDVGEIRRSQVAAVRRTLGGLGAVVAEVGPDLRYVWIDNPHPDFDSGDVVGKRDDDLLPATEAGDIMALKQAAFETGEPRTRILGFNRSDGRVYYGMSAYPVRSSAAGGVEAVLTVAFPYQFVRP